MKLIQYNIFLRLNVHFCVLAFTFTGCLPSNDSNAVFTIDKCQLTGQLIQIQKALIQFSSQWNASDSPPMCQKDRGCAYTITKHDQIIGCNGRDKCDIDQTVFNYQERKCNAESKGNYISVTYYCYNGENVHHCFPINTALLFVMLKTESVAYIMVC